jgi:phage terminase large subunit-like protein
MTAAVHTKPEVEALPVASIRKHLKKLHTTAEYLQKYCRWFYYRPHPDTQLIFHNSHARERSIVLGNQQGKTLCCSFEMAYAACDWWPEWHTGLHPKPPNVERAAKFIGLYASVSAQGVREGAQEKLLGPISQEGGLGTGAMPLDFIEGVTMSRGISNFVDTITVRRETGGIALLQSRTYEQSERMFQTISADLCWLDEDMGFSDLIYNEVLARGIAVNGRTIVSLTPMLGVTPIRKRFIDSTDQNKIFQIRGGIEKALHISPERRQEIINSIPEHQRASRIYGLEQLGEGAVFATPVNQIMFDRSPQTFPEHWPIVNACDFSHGGQAASAHPMAVCSAAIDPSTGTIYIFDAYAMHGMLPEQQVARIKQSPLWDAPWLWPHDGQQVAQAGTGETIARMYRRLGLPMRDTWTTFSDKDGGGYSLEAGIAIMQQRFANGTLLVASHLKEFFKEYVGYHYKEGRIVKENDDILSACRQIVMGYRFARVLDASQSIFERMHEKKPQRFATGVNDWDVLTGQPYER